MTEVGAISESLEDYLEIIYHLVSERKVARVKEIAGRKGVKMASVTSALKRLAKDGLVRYAAREYVDLTEAGWASAARVVARHDFLRRFFSEVLGLDAAQAEADACSVEHHLSQPALERLAALYARLTRLAPGRQEPRPVRSQRRPPAQSARPAASPVASHRPR